MSGLELLSDQGYRYDGRKPPEIRRLECRMGIFDHADGSSYVEFGNTKVVACVYGPHQLLQGDGGLYSACINAGTLALVDAGIPIRDLICGCAAGLINEVPVVDLNHLEENLGRSELNLAILPKTQSIVLQEMTSVMHIDHYVKVLDCAIRGCLDVQPILESVIMDHCRQKMNGF